MAGAPFDPAEFYAFAESLRFRWNQDEASVRTTMSRAYYSALIVARDHKGLSSLDRDSHWTVIKAYSNTDATEKQVRDALLAGKALRERADYEPLNACLKQQAEESLKKARIVLSALVGKQPGARQPLVPFEPPTTTVH